MMNDKIHSRGFLFYLMLTAVLCGALVMLIEVLGSRVIGPYFGVGLFVWTSLIAVALLSLAFGYWLGGMWADKREHPDNLYGIILVSGFLVLLIPVLKGPILSLCMAMGLRMGAFTSTLLLFGPSLFLLGCVSPYLIKIATREFHLIGRTVGRFYALSTLGSTIGTTITGFFLIAYLGVNTIFQLTGAALILLAVLYFALFRRRWWLMLLLVLPMITMVDKEPTERVLSSGTQVKVVADRDSYYGNIKVVDYSYGDQWVRDLMIDGLIQGGMDMVGKVSLYEYAYLMDMISYGLHPSGSRALVVGLGAGLVPMALERRNISVDVVDIDPVVVEMARDYFDFAVSGDVHVTDARYFLTVNQNKYDYIYLDVFNGDLTPGHVISLEAFTLVKERMTADGVLAINLISTMNGDTAGTFSIKKTLEQLFTHVQLFPIVVNTKQDELNENVNVIAIAYNGPEKSFNFDLVRDTPIYHKSKQWVMNAMFNPVVLSEPQRTPIVLHDDFNPIDIWDINAREQVRASILQYIDAGLLVN